MLWGVLLLHFEVSSCHIGFMGGDVGAGGGAGGGAGVGLGVGAI